MEGVLVAFWVASSEVQRFRNRQGAGEIRGIPCGPLGSSLGDQRELGSGSVAKRKRRSQHHGDQSTGP